MAKQQSATSIVAVPEDLIDRKIYLVRALKVIVDSDLAELYRVETKMLNRAVQRNLDRFPSDFMFQLTAEEAESLRYQSGTSTPGRGGRRYLPHVFTGARRGYALVRSPQPARNPDEHPDCTRLCEDARIAGKPQRFG